MLLVTLEILVAIVAPLLILCSTGRWPMRLAIPCLLVIPVLWHPNLLAHSRAESRSRHLLGGRFRDGAQAHSQLLARGVRARVDYAPRSPGTFGSSS